MSNSLSKNQVRDTKSPVVWHVSQEPVSYDKAECFMRQRSADISLGKARELIWLLEHPSLYTAGTSADPKDLLSKDRFPVFKTGRGGQYTYHGPGQRVVYVMLDLRVRGGTDVRKFIDRLQRWIIQTLSQFEVEGEVRPDRVGVWVRSGHEGYLQEDKIAALGIRLYRWISLHGLSINVSVDLNHYEGIVSCGITEHGVTSLQKLGLETSLKEVDEALNQTFRDVFDAPLIVPHHTDPVRVFL